MLRALAMFLLLFTVLASVVHTDGLVNLFGLGALALLATDLFVYTLRQTLDRLQNTESIPPLAGLLTRQLIRLRNTQTIKMQGDRQPVKADHPA